MSKLNLTNEEKEDLFNRLEEIYESIQLGTTDNALLGLMIFIVSISLALLSIGLPKLFLNSPYVLTGAIIFFFFLILPLILYIYIYSRAVFFKERSFNNRAFVISYLSWMVLFVVGIWLFLFIAWIYERWWITPFWLSIAVIVLLSVGAALLVARYIHPRIWSYFNENYKHLLKRRKKELGLDD